MNRMLERAFLDRNTKTGSPETLGLVIFECSGWYVKSKKMKGW